MIHRLDLLQKMTMYLSGIIVQKSLAWFEPWTENFTMEILLFARWFCWWKKLMHHINTLDIHQKSKSKKTRNFYGKVKMELIEKSHMRKMFVQVKKTC